MLQAAINEYQIIARELDAKKAAGLDPVIYGKAVEWTLSCGAKMRVSVNGCWTAEEANEKAWKMADESGWTAPRWWQWWRWRDTPRP